MAGGGGGGGWSIQQPNTVHYLYPLLEILPQSYSQAILRNRVIVDRKRARNTLIFLARQILNKQLIFPSLTLHGQRFPVSPAEGATFHAKSRQLPAPPSVWFGSLVSLLFGFMNNAPTFYT